MNSVVVQDLEESREPQLGLTLMAGSQGLKKKITHPQIQKMGLALTGFIRFVHAERLQVIGKTEMTYFHTLKGRGSEKGHRADLQYRPRLRGGDPSSGDS